MPDDDDDNGFRPNPDDASQPLATSLKPLTSATLTVRVVKSFEFRTAKAMILKDVNLLETTVQALMDKVREGMSVIQPSSPYPLDLRGERSEADDPALKTAAGFKPYRTLQLGTSWAASSSPRFLGDRLHD
jgi:hypothetical protein